MKKTIIYVIFFLLTTPVFCQRNTVFFTPTHYYGVINDVTSSARAEALGKNTITISGLKTAFENPATIAPGEDKIQVAVNYTKGHSYHPKSYYPSMGIAYRVTQKINIGFSMHHWIDPKSYWNSEIGGSTFNADKRSQHVYSFIAASRITKNLFIGFSGNLLRGKAINNTVTSKDFIINTGIIYDKPLHLLKLKSVTNENLRLAASLFNILMDGQTVQRANETVFQYRDQPAILRIGGAHSFSFPLNTAIVKKSKLFKQAPQIIEFTTRLQYTNYLKANKNYTQEHKYNTMTGIGIEATALNFLSARIGYFTETRQPADNTTDRFATKAKRKGFTWGLGCIIPADKWSNGRLPLEFRFDILAKNQPDLLEEKYSQLSHKDFTDKKLMLSIGLEFTLKK